jgi:RND family efflux transporter MFP subunit
MVVTAAARAGKIANEVTYVGTVYYVDASKVASEVRGKVEEVKFEDGDRVAQGQTLVKLDSELLEKEIAARKASHERVLVDLDKARADFERFSALFKEEFVSAQEFDAVKFHVMSLTKEAEANKAGLEGLEVELEKKVVKAPFAGIIIKRHADRGEWMEAGSPVAELAATSEMDVIVNVPEHAMKMVGKGSSLSVKAGSGSYRGRVVAVVPRGDVETRTFPVKIRISGATALVEGMEAQVSLPLERPKDAIIVPRDAVISQFGSDVVFVVDSGNARMIKVSVVGFSGKDAGVASPELKPGMAVVIKGNERLRDGQPVMPAGAPMNKGASGAPGAPPARDNSSKSPQKG